MAVLPSNRCRVSLSASRGGEFRIPHNEAQGQSPAAGHDVPACYDFAGESGLQPKAFTIISTFPLNGSASPTGRTDVNAALDC